SVHKPKRMSNLDADFIIGGLFPVHVQEKNNVRCDEKLSAWFYYMETAMGNKVCYKMNVFGLMWVEATLFAIAEINNRKDILPNITLGFDIRDSANDVHNALNASLDFVLPLSDPTTNKNTSKSSHGDTCICLSKNSIMTRRVSAVIGGAGSTISKAVNNVLSMNNIPQISYSSTSPALSDKTFFPSFLRTIPPDYIQAEVMADLVAYYGWSYVSVVATDEDYGRLGIEAFKQEVKSRNVCISVDELFHPNNNLPETKASIKSIVTKLKNDKKATVVVLFCESPNALAVLEEAEQQGLHGKTWIGAEAWGDKSTVLDFKNSTVGGMLGVLPWKGRIETFEEHMAKLTPLNSNHNPWFREFWEGNFGCVFDDLSSPTHISKSENFSRRGVVFSKGEKVKCSNYEGTPSGEAIQLNKAPNVMDSVYAIGWALHSMLNCTPGGPSKPGTCSKRDHTFTPSDLLEEIKKTSFTGKLGYPVQFDKHGDTKGNYLIKSLQPDHTSPHGHSFVTIGYWSWTTRQLQLSKNNITWNNGSRHTPFSRCSAPCAKGEYPVQGSVPCCWTCVKCPRGSIKNSTGTGGCVPCDKGYTSDAGNSECLKLPEIYLQLEGTMSVVVLTCSSVGIILTAVVFVVFIRYGGTAVVKASAREFSFMMLLMIVFMFLLTILYIGRPTQTMCKARPFCFAFIMTFWTSLMLTKTNRLLLIFKNKKVAVGEVALGIRCQLILALFLTLISMATTLAWVMSFPPNVTLHYFDTHVTVDCGGESHTLLILLLGYTAVLAAITTFLSYKARHLPENFNESRYIGFSMFTFCVIWCCFIPLFLTTDPAMKYTCLCLALCVTGLVTLVCMFSNRLRIILFHPERNRTEIVR
ncbi:predicted protein, partial [Nematostella vectensis]